MTAAAAPVDLRTTLGWTRRRRDVVSARGPEAVGYLQGQLSQDVASLPAGASARSFVLQPTGKVDAWVRVTRTADDELVLDVDVGHGEALLARLRRFLLRTKAELDLLDWQVVALRGPGAEAAAARAGAELAVPAGWPAVEGVDLLGSAPEPPGDVPEADAAALEALRIRSGVPQMGAELTAGTIPAEAGRWVIEASVSFAKGCFTGQELVARIDSRGGNVPRQLRGLLVPGTELPPPGAVLVAEGREVGTVTSVARGPGGGAGGEVGLALAYVGRAVAPPASAEARVGDRSLPVTVVGLPMA